MGNLLDQVRKQKTLIICLALLLFVTICPIFFYLIYSNSLKQHNPQESINIAITFGLLFAGLLFLWIIGVFIVHTILDGTKKMIESLTPFQLENFAKETVGVNFYKNIFTVTDSLIILNANHYSLKIIFLTDLDKINIVTYYPPKAWSEYKAVEFHLKSKKVIRSCGMSVKRDFANQKIVYLQNKLKIK